MVASNSAIFPGETLINLRNILAGSLKILSGDVDDKFGNSS